MIVSIHQPHYVPWLGYFDKVDSADVFVILDSVQYEKNGWQNRNRIKTANGWMWLTVPVKHSFGLTIRETGIDNSSKWGKKHFQSLVSNYSKAPFFSDHRAFFETLYSERHESIQALTDRMFHYFIEAIGIETRIETASELGSFPDEPNERLAAMVKSLGGDTYLAGSGSRAYIDESVFRDYGISLIFQDYQPLEYSQLYNGFEAGLAVVDALFNLGPDTLEIIRKGRRTKL